MTEVFHLELRQFPHTARAFNLSEPELRTGILEPWSTGQIVRWAEQDFDPRRARLRIIAGPALAAHQLSMGRGWQEAQRQGREVTAALLPAPSPPTAPAVPAQALQELKAELQATAAAAPLTLGAAVQIAVQRMPQLPAAQAAQLAEQAVAELLREGAVALQSTGPRTL